MNVSFVLYLGDNRTSRIAICDKKGKTNKNTYKSVPIRESLLIVWLDKNYTHGHLSDSNIVIYIEKNIFQNRTYITIVITIYLNNSNKFKVYGNFVLLIEILLIHYVVSVC